LYKILEFLYGFTPGILHQSKSALVIQPLKKTIYYV